MQQKVHDVERKGKTSETQRFLLLLELMANGRDKTRLFVLWTESSITDHNIMHTPLLFEYQNRQKQIEMHTVINLVG